jgi:2-polyprenyl-6-methoxyphenol hydroxylase-like FAD-dependent oxidoreductase
MRVAVAGGGIAGLTAAVALAARGNAVDLYERTPKLEEIGAGIQLSPNAMAVLDRLAVVGDLKDRLFEPEALVIRNAQSGAELTRVPLGKPARTRYGSPYCTLHRADLQAGLVAAAKRARAIELHLGAEVADVAGREDAVAFTAGGLERRADVLIAADGIRSQIRTGYFALAGPKRFGRTAWRAILPAADVEGIVRPDVTGLWLGANAHLVHYAIEGGRSLNIVAIARGDGATPPLESFGRDARRLIDAVSAWTHRPLLYLDHAVSWSRGRVALIGDAAHAMAPSAAQGGVQAIEDAWVLAAALERDANRPQRGLVRFESERKERVSRVARASHRNLNTYELGGVPALLRDSILKALPTSLLLSQLDWLFGWRPQ